MSKVVIMEPCILVSENEFTKCFKYNKIELYLSKAYDDVDNKHFLIASIPEIPECKVAHIQFPIPFNSEIERDEKFKTFTTLVASNFIDQIINQIKDNNSKIKS